MAFPACSFSSSLDQLKKEKMREKIENNTYKISIWFQIPVPLYNKLAL